VKNNFLSSHWKYLLILIVIGTSLRFYGLTFRELHFDEKASIGCSVGIPIAGIMQVKTTSWEDLGLNPAEFSPKDFWKYNTLESVYKATLFDNGSIFYFTLLHFWVDSFGHKIITYRLLSVIFGLLAILSTYLVALRLFESKRIAVISGLLLSLNPVHIYSSEFIRSHAMACFIAMICTVLFLDLLKEKKTSVFLLYGTVCGAGMLSHYFFSYVIIGHIFFMALLVRDKQSWKHFILGGMLAMFCFLFWMLNGGLEGFKNLEVVNTQFRGFSDHWKEGDNPYYMPFTIRSFIGGVTQVLLSSSGNWLQLLGVSLSKLVILAVMFWGFVTYGVIRVKEKRKEFWILILIPLAYFVWAAVFSYNSNFTIYFQPVYALYIIPFVSILFAYLIDKLLVEWKSKSLYVVAAIQIGIIIVSIFANYTAFKKHEIDYELEAKIIKSEVNEQHPLKFRSWEKAFLTNLYLKDMRLNEILE
jgi:uncharacterized membrane protein